MDQNQDFVYSGIGLPEDIQRMKDHGDFEGAIRLIDARLAGELPQCMAANYRAQREILVRLPGNYPYTREEALDIVRKEIPDFTMEELQGYLDAGRIMWIYNQGEVRCISSFFGSLMKTEKAFAARAKPQDVGHRDGEDDPKKTGREGMLDRSMRILREKGSMGCVTRMRHTVTIKDAYFVPGETYEVHIPLPIPCIQQSDIQLLGFSSQPTHIAPESAPQRTVYWKETMTENHPFWVEYSVRHVAPFSDPAAVTADPIQPTFDTQEVLPHIVFTPYIRALCAELTRGVYDPVEKARRIYDYITLNVKYSFQPSYFVLESIAENCLKSLRGDCGVQALAFITLCRCAGIPARWQSGLIAEPDNAGCHDWAMFYVAPYGWMFADPSFGGGAVRAGKEARRRHYFGNLDMYRVVTANTFQAQMDPPAHFWRSDPYDNQVGEVQSSKEGLRGFMVSHDMEVLEQTEL